MWRKRIVAVLLACAVLAVSSACAETLEERVARLEWQSNRSERSWQQGERQERLDLEGFELLLENEALAVYYREQTAGIRVKNKQTGYVWGGLEADKPDSMNKKWSAVGNSLAWMTYYTTDGMEKSTAVMPAAHQVTVALNDGDEATFHLDFADVGIAFDLVLTLKADGFTLTLPDTSIHEASDNRLGWVCINPFFGTVSLRDTVEGYMLLPDGCGALMRFDRHNPAAGSYEKRIYGQDYASDLLYSLSDIASRRPNAFATAEEQLLMPVFGMVHGEGCDAYLARVTSGGEYGSICAVPGGVVTDYAYLCAKFLYRQKFSQPVSRSGAGIQVVQGERNVFDAQVQWTLLGDENADYSGMARAYRRQLLEEGKLTESQPAAGEIPMQVDFLMNGVEQGFMFHRTFAFSTMEDVKDCLAQLQAPVVLTLTGWQQGGMDGNRLANASIPAQMGGEGWKTAMEDLHGLCKTVCLAVNPMWGNEKQLDKNSEAIQTLSQTTAALTTTGGGAWLGKRYLLRPSLAADHIQALAKQMTGASADGLLLSGMGHDLYADQNRGTLTTRTEALQLTSQALEVASEQGLLMLSQPNEYAFSAMDAFADTPMFNSQFLYETDTVPFLQLVLRGSVPLFAPYANECFYSRQDILRMIDYGVCPSFLFTGVGNALMRHTTQADLTSTCYTDWVETACDIYAQVNAALAPVQGCAMLRHEMLPCGVSLSYYENGLIVAVNHLSQPATVLGEEIAALSACVMEVQP